MSRRAVVLGLGRSGAACATVLAREGWDVLVADRADGDELRARAQGLPAGVALQLGGYTPEVVDGAAMVCPSPGIHWHAPELERARSLHIPVRSEIDLVFERCRGSVLGITGTNGKTTTTALVASILEHGGDRVHLGGNIGETMLDRLEPVADGDWVVLELSSFQLESARSPRCAIACVLNVTPDHLDRHGSFEAYRSAKEKIVRFAERFAVLGYDDPVTRAMAEAASCPVRYFGRSYAGDQGTTLSGDQVVSVEASVRRRVLTAAEIPLLGPHNVDNVLAAVAMARAAGVAVERIADAVRSFSPVPHRLQPLGEHAGVLWVNDSKATNAESAMVALRSFPGRPVVWIGGGKSKGVPAAPLVEAVIRHARFAVLNGETGPELDAALQAQGYGERRLVSTLDEAVAAAAEVARPGEVVLLAPGYASFDQFRRFEERGDAFAERVARLARERR